jgi:hypothetical protein
MFTVVVCLLLFEFIGCGGIGCGVGCCVGCVG